MALARVPRVKGGSGNAAFAPGTVGGRQAHPPRAEARVVKEIPKKEKHLALLSAIAATASKETVELRGHEVEGVLEIPLVVEDSLSELTKAKEVEEAFTNLGLLTDIYRVRESRGIRAGKGKHRGRKMKQAIGPLIVITENKGIVKAASNLPGVDVVTVSDLNAEVLAPGTHAGRLTVWTTSAIAEVGKLYSAGENA
jgi:large subunit ribosomal protein L4e